MMYCGGCGHWIWFFQKRERHDLGKNPVRRAMTDVPFHPKCWARFPEDAK